MVIIEGVLKTTPCLLYYIYLKILRYVSIITIKSLNKIRQELDIHKEHMVTRELVIDVEKKGPVSITDRLTDETLECGRVGSLFFRQNHFPSYQSRILVQTSIYLTLP